MRHCLIAYDIGDGPRRSRMADRLAKKGRRIQKSVFVLEIGEAALQTLEQELQELIDENDSLLILPVCESCLDKARVYQDLPAAFLMAD